MRIGPSGAKGLPLLSEPLEVPRCIFYTQNFKSLLSFVEHVNTNLTMVYDLRNKPMVSISTEELQMLLFPNALCCSLNERNCVCPFTKIFTKFLPANSFCQLLQVTRKRSCTLGMINRGRLELATSPIET